MQKLVGLINTTAIVVEPIKKLFKEMLPGVRVLNFVDEGILEAGNCILVRTSAEAF
jgi:hypothetical protein